METLNITQIQQSINAVTPNRINQPQNITEDDAAKKIKEQNSSEKIAVTKAVYGDVLDVSEDGDTVTARPESVQASEDGFVFLKEENETDEDKELNAEEKGNHGSLNGLSEQQIETLRRQGKISENEYRTEMERRSQLEEQMKLSSIGAEADKEEIENAALDTALKNNRSELMMDVFASQEQ